MSVGEKAMAREKRKKTSGEKIREKQKERENSKLNIKLHFTIGSSRRKDPTRRNSAVTKRASSKESYFSGIKLFAVGEIAPNITYYSRQSATCCFKMCLRVKDFGDNFRNAAKRKTANYFEINKTWSLEIRTVKIIVEQFSPEESVIGETPCLTRQRVK